MSGWCPSSSVCGMAVGVLLLSCPVQRCGSCPTHPTAVLASTAVMSCTVRCRVLRCVGGVCVCGVRVMGYPLSAPPSSWWRVGPSWMVGGMVSEGRQYGVDPPVCVLASPSCSRGGPVEWRGVACCCDALSSDWVLPFTLPLSLYVAFASLPFVCAALCWGWGSAVVVCERSVWSRCLLFSSLFFLSSPLLCVGVRGSARAALRARTLSPNTIASLLLLALSCFLFSSLLCPPHFFVPRLSCYCGMAVGVIHHVSVYCVGMTAMGSLSRSSLFFW